MKNFYKLSDLRNALVLIMLTVVFNANAKPSMAKLRNSVAICMGNTDNGNLFEDGTHITGSLYTTANYISRGSSHDTFSILFAPEYDNALNSADAVKPMNFTENMGIGTPENPYSIEKRELPSEDEDLAFFITNYNHQNYEMVFNVGEFLNTTPYLIDSYSGEQMPLQFGETAYNFQVDPNIAESLASNRFHLHFGNEILSTNPSNDDLCNAIGLTVGATCTGNAYTVTGATVQPGEPSGTCWYNGATATNSVWFSFIAPSSGNAKITTDFPGSTLTDSEIAIYEAPMDCTDLNTLGPQIACDEDGGSGRSSLAILSGLTPGETYYIQVNGYNGATGDFCIEVKDDGYVYKNGSWSPQNPNGQATAADNITIVNGTARFTQNIEVNTITVDLGATLKVGKVLTINGDIHNNGTFLFKSTGTGNGELAAVPSGSVILGDMTIERYMSDHRSYRFISSPVSTSTSIHANWQEDALSADDDPNPGFGTHITGTLNDQENGFDATGTGKPSLFTLNVNGQQFEAVGNTDVNTITAGQAYLLYSRGNRAIDLTSNTSHSSTILRTTGTLHTGPLTKNLGTVEGGKFIAVANPYQSSTDINSVLTHASANINKHFAYVYDPHLGGGDGGYATVDLLTNTTIPSSSTANQYLQPGQALQVKVQSTGTTSFAFNENDKAPGMHTTTFSNDNPYENNIYINAQLFTTENYASGNTSNDAFKILFSQDFTNALNSMDAVKSFNFTENMGVGTPDQAFSIERQGLPTQGENIALFNTNYNHQNYTLVLKVGTFENTNPYLVDSYTGEETELQLGENLINFNVDQDVPGSTEPNRFHIHFGPSTLSANTNKTDLGIKLYPNPAQSGDAFYVSAEQFKGQDVNINITTILGKTVYRAKKQSDSGKIAIQTKNLLDTGVYFVTIGQGSKKVVKRLIIN